MRVNVMKNRDLVVLFGIAAIIAAIIFAIGVLTTRSSVPPHRVFYVTQGDQEQYFREARRRIEPMARRHDMLLRATGLYTPERAREHRNQLAMMAIDSLILDLVCGHYLGYIVEYEGVSDAKRR